MRGVGGGAPGDAAGSGPAPTLFIYLAKKKKTVHCYRAPFIPILSLRTSSRTLKSRRVLLSTKRSVAAMLIVVQSVLRRLIGAASLAKASSLSRPLAAGGRGVRVGDTCSLSCAGIVPRGPVVHAPQPHVRLWRNLLFFQSWGKLKGLQRHYFPSKCN